jgi:hypothetical protein
MRRARAEGRFASVRNLHGGFTVALLLTACGSSPRTNVGGGDGGVVADAADPTGDGGISIGRTSVYANTQDTLFQVNPDTLAITRIGTFSGAAAGDQMTDIAIDKAGNMVGVSFTAVYKIDPSTAATTLLSSGLSGDFNGLSFVPSEALGQPAGGADVLVGARNSDGAVFRVDPTTGGTTQIGNLGAYVSSGDLVAVAGFGTVLTASGASADQLVRLAPSTFAATAIGAGTGFGQIWGLAYWKNKIFGFTSGGQFVLIDPTTGVGTLVSSSSQAWWGAAVTTSAPILQ